MFACLFDLVWLLLCLLADSLLCMLARRLFARSLFVFLVRVFASLFDWLLVCLLFINVLVRVVVFICLYVFVHV